MALFCSVLCTVWTTSASRLFLFPTSLTVSSVRQRTPPTPYAALHCGLGNFQQVLESVRSGKLIMKDVG